MIRKVLSAGATAVLAVTATVAVTGGGTSAGAADGFFRWTGTKPLSQYSRGAVLKTRELKYSLDGVPLPVDVTQVLYRTQNARGQAIANATSVLHAPGVAATNKVVSYQSFYDSLSPADSPSRAIAGGTSFGGQSAHAESLLMAPFLLQGYDIVVTDTEGPTADFAAGPEYGRTTLDALRAVSGQRATGISASARIGLVGYSGGAIATNWAAAIAPAYAPDVNRRIVGAASGGVLVDPAHNLHYVEGSLVWAGVMPMAIVGVARAYGVDLTPYLSAYGKQVYDQVKDQQIFAVLGRYPGLTWKQLAKPQYPTPESVPVFVKLVNRLNLGSQPTPTVPLFVGQGAGGETEGTPGTKPGIGRGDGVMIAGDVRSLARQYCRDGLKVSYKQYELTSHVATAALWLPDAYAWLLGRFGGQAAPTNCGSIAPGNPLTPIGG
ncbi:alpha/beta hydrolase family protein [Jatrophihabitans fulvus]